MPHGDVLVFVSLGCINLFSFILLDIIVVTSRETDVENNSKDNGR